MRLRQRIAGDQLSLPRDFHGAQFIAGRGIEPPGALGGSRQDIAVGGHAAGFIQPEFPGEIQTRGPLRAHAAHLFLNSEGRLGLPQMHRQLPPRFREGGLGDIHRSDAAQLNHAQLRSGLEADEFGLCQGLHPGGITEFRRRIVAESGEPDLPFPGAHLGLDAPIFLHGTGNR